MQVRVTPIAEDGSRGEPIVHDNVTGYDHDVTPDPDGGMPRETLVLLSGDEEIHRYPLNNHWVEITPDPPAVETVQVDTEEPDALGNHPDDVRAQFARDQAAADRAAQNVD